MRSAKVKLRPRSEAVRDAGHAVTRPYDSPYGGYGYSDPGAGSNHTPTMHRNRNYDISKSFDEFWDDSATQKCMRVRCRHCGFVRAKNTTRQVEHLSTCRDFLNSSEGQQALANGDLVPQPTDANGDIWRGGAPNPNLQGMINRRGPQKNPRSSMSNAYTPARPAAPKPSLATHLLNRVADSLTDATHKSFLSHAGCGTLSAHALKQWLAQEIHISRALIPFVGSLVGKIRIPETSELQQDPTFRALDLLVSAASNMKKELEFLENTKTKYGMQVAPEEPKPATRGFVDLLVSASSPQSSLLEGLVVLYATEHLFCTSFQYAASFVSQMPASSTSYSLPSYLTPGQSGNPYATSTGHVPDNTHITALHDAFIPNWSSPNFARFVGACKSIVDESANSQTSGNGRAEMQACERVFKQVIYLWGGIWPDVDGMGEEDGLEQNDHQQNGSADKAIEIGDDGDPDAEAAVDSPYGGTGLGAIVAHNRESIPGDLQRSQTLA
ncbi:heme oxygenase-like protein [Teratosphaeria nubilosa]|uniref:Heme oxygenase-like protein n=1 Tax=Teratosphaeria nubilosa TaxID=161662 RepID=A0A6G1LLM8_9PEZI|nr:heme oxygenase-like protein [Teratosphaeria nubilosa]